jgi:quinol-cytochrome oxidoreductase complex cytochrome b subunit
MGAFIKEVLENKRKLLSRLPGELHPGAGKEPGPQRNLFLHLHPARVYRQSLRFSATFGLGVISITLLLVLGATGVLLMFFYQPSATEAYQSIQDIQYAVPWGRVVRAMHRWAGHALVACVFLHFLRVAFSAAWRRRELNWVIGLGQGALVLGLAFTGYLLPWDQLSYWAVRVVSGMLDNFAAPGRWLKQLLLGSDEVGPAALLRFYTLHVALLPAVLLTLALLHIWRIRRDGGLAREKQLPPEELVPTWPPLILREAVLAAAAVLAVFAAAIFLPAPLGQPLDYTTPSNPEKAPWYFLGLQEMLSHSAIWGGVVFPLLFLLLLLFLPWLDRADEGVGALGASRRLRLLIAASAGLAALTLALGEWLWAARSDPASEALSPPAIILYISLLVFFAAGYLSGSTRGAFFGWLAFLLTALVGFTLVGLLRGPDWKFFWPGEGWPGGL